MRKSGVILGAAALGLLGLVALLWTARRSDASGPVPPPAGPAEERDEWSTEPIRPLPRKMKLDERRVALGARLFADPRLSRDGTISCASCHDLSRGGADSRARSVGVGGHEGDVNAPTVFNVAFNFKQFWDGRADTLEEQVEGPLTHPKEMGASWEHLLAVSKASYGADFAAAFPDGVSRAALKSALADYLRSLTTPSRFDRWLRGDLAAMSERETKGYDLFKRRGCVTCHQGMNVGGNIFAKFGSIGDYFADRGRSDRADLGRFNVTSQEEDRHTFKVPGLRNVALTAPYFHDGSAATLREAVEVMSRYQLGRKLPPEEIDLICAFLGALSAEAR